MSYKKLIVIALAVFISSCTRTPSAPTDFVGLYQAHTRSQIASLSEAIEKIGYIGKYETTGSLKALANIPTLLSGSVSTSYEGVIDGYGIGQDSRIVFRNPSLRYETLLASGSLEAKEWSLISRGSDMYMKYIGLTGTEIIDDAMQSVLSRYEDTWLALTERDLLETLSGATDEERLSYQMSQAIGRIRIEDIEKYLTAYPLWKETKSLGNIDGLSTYEVTLAKENIIAMIEQFTKDSTGKTLTETAKKGITESLANTEITGTIGYSTTDVRTARMNLKIKDMSTNEEALLSLHESSDNWKLSSTASGTVLDTHIMKTPDGYTLTLLMKDSETTLAKIDTRLQFDGDRLMLMTTDFTSDKQGISMKVRHEYKSDRSFVGELDAGIGKLTWNGKMGNQKNLDEFHMHGAMVGSTITMDLTPGTGGLLRGPFVMKNGDNIVTQADVGLRVDAEHLSLVLDIPSPESPTVRTHAEIHVEGKREKSAVMISIPENTKPFTELSDALSALTPEPLWTEATEEPLGGTLSGAQ